MVKKETLIIIFYVLYFSWLFTIIYISPQVTLLNLFTAVIIVFYFLFLREDGDFIWFIATFIGAFLGKLTSVVDKRLIFQFEEIIRMPFWLPIAWGTTVLALRKFFLLINVGKD